MNTYLICKKHKNHQRAVDVCIAIKCPKLSQIDDVFICTHKTRVELYGERYWERRKNHE